MERFCKDEEKKLMKEKGLKNQKELEDWYKKREESIRNIQEGIKRFFFGNK
jgi:hypothetical protein